jgi:uncharacterized membrane protein YhaH (DUF805 family)
MGSCCFADAQKITFAKSKCKSANLQDPTGSLRLVTRGGRYVEVGMINTLFSLKGRVRRKTYWFCRLFFFGGIVLIGMLDEAINGEEDAGILIAIFLLLTFWPLFATEIKRWHDRNKSGWWIFIVFVPLIGSIWSLVETGFLKGTEGSNMYGDDPLQKNYIIGMEEMRSPSDE